MTALESSCNVSATTKPFEKVLTQQNDMWKEWKEKHTELSHQLSLMEDKIHNSSYSSNCSQTERKKVKVTRELTVRLIIIM